MFSQSDDLVDACAEIDQLRDKARRSHDETMARERENAELRQKLATAELRYKEAELRLAAFQERIHAALTEVAK